jgi:FMN-binding domain
MNDRHYIRWLAPVAACIAAPAYAATYFTVPQAQAALFPGQTMTEVRVTLTPIQIKAIEKASGTRVREKNLKLWKATNGGWFYLDQVIGKHELITYGLALNSDGVVSGIEILDYRETYGSEVRNPKWRAQFVGKRIGAPLKLDVDIVNLSGATLSSRNIATGVRRLLNTHAYVANQG